MNGAVDAGMAYLVMTSPIVEGTPDLEASPLTQADALGTVRPAISSATQWRSWVSTRRTGGG